MLTIWKFSLHIADVQSVDLPRGAIILSVQVQRGQLQLWAEVDSEAVVDPRPIWIRGTGHSLDGLPPLRRHISTFQMSDGDLVFHAYEQVSALKHYVEDNKGFV